MPVRAPASEDNEIQEGKSKLIGLSTPTHVKLKSSAHLGRSRSLPTAHLYHLNL